MKRASRHRSDPAHRHGDHDNINHNIATDKSRGYAIYYLES